MDTSKKIQKTISEGIAKAKGAGFTLICEDWGDDKQMCACPLGCLIVANGIKLSIEPAENYTKAIELLGQTNEWINSFIAGYDKGFLTYGEKTIDEAYKMGEKFREELDPLRYHVYLAKRDHEND